MTPYDLYCQYRDLSVTLSDFKTVYGIDVHEYRNADPKYSNTGFSVKDGDDAFKALQKKIGEYGQPAGYKRYLINHPVISRKEFNKTPYVPVWQEYVTTFPDLYEVYLGKGSIDQIKQALRLAVAFGLVNDNKTDLQKYCDKNIGLDCSGFAKSFFNGDFSKIEDLAAQYKLTNLSEVRPGTSIIWENLQHIALVDRIIKVERTGNSVYAVDCMVAESTGDKMLQDGPSDGLNYTAYTILGNKSGDIFEVFRSLAKDRGYYKPKVYLVNK